MTPAQTTDLTTYGSCTLVQREQFPKTAPWGPWSPPATISTSAVAVEVGIRPQSVSNPIRVDGTRGVSGWHHVWAGGVPNQTSVTVQLEYTWNNIQYRLSGPFVDGAISWYTWRDVVAGCGGQFAVGGPFPYGIESRARTNFLLALASGKADLGVALGEIRQTMGLVSSAASQAVRAIDKAVTASRGLPRSVVREILNFGRIPPRRGGEPRWSYNRRVARERAVLQRWLEYQFGVKPLIQDIQDAGQALSDSIFEKAIPLTIHIKKGAGSEEPGSWSHGGVYGLPAVGLEVACLVETACHIAATYDVPVGTGRTFNQLGLRNPYAVAWELTQFSWLVDYLTTTGKWLESLTAKSGVSFLEGTITRIQRFSNLNTRVIPMSSNCTIVDGAGWINSNLVGGKMTRDVLVDVVPAYRPAVHERLNATRMANVLSVLALRAKLT